MQFPWEVGSCERLLWKVKQQYLIRWLDFTATEHCEQITYDPTKHNSPAIILIMTKIIENTMLSIDGYSHFSEFLKLAPFLDLQNANQIIFNMNRSPSKDLLTRTAKIFQWQVPPNMYLDFSFRDISANSIISFLEALKGATIPAWSQFHFESNEIDDNLEDIAIALCKSLNNLELGENVTFDFSEGVIWVDNTLSKGDRHFEKESQRLWIADILKQKNTKVVFYNR